MDEKEREEGGISIGEILRVIFSQKWILLAILVIVTVAGTFGIYFGKNSMSGTYKVSFTLELPRTEIKDKTDKEDTTVKSQASVVYYPDGTPFYYTDIVSLSTLQRVKDTNEAFKNINVEQMAKSGDISITRTINETALNSGSFEAIYDLSVKTSYFTDKDVATDFVVALTKTPIDYLGLMDIDYDVYINSARVAPDYVTELTQLMNQTSYIINRYNTFIEIYNDLSVDGKTLRSYCQEVSSYLNDIAELDILRAEVRKECYLKSEDLISRYEIELEKLQRQYDIASFTLENLKDKGSNNESISADVFKTQSDLVKELEKEMNEITGYDTENGRVVGFLNSSDYGDHKSAKHIAFLANLNKAYDKVQSYTDEFKKVVSHLYSKVSVVSYSNSNVIVMDGVTGIVMSFVISFVAGLVIAMVVAFIVGWVMKKKALRAAQATTATQTAEVKDWQAQSDKENQ